MATMLLVKPHVEHSFPAYSLTKQEGGTTIKGLEYLFTFGISRVNGAINAKIITNINAPLTNLYCSVISGIINVVGPSAPTAAALSPPLT